MNISKIRKYLLSKLKNMNDSRHDRTVDREYCICMPKYFQCPENFLERVYNQQVVLENVFTRDITVYGTVRVNNCSFYKNVFVRFTINSWRTFSVINAYHSMHYADNNTDSFQFKMTIPIDELLTLSFEKSKLLISSINISFAICYCVNGQEFWDNNYSTNYNFEIVEK